jgi:hypothetical protein
MRPSHSPEAQYATEGNLLLALHEARFAGGVAASGQRAGFGGNLFTRDSCRMMRDTMDRMPSMSRELLSILPQMQGVEFNPQTNEMPDAMPHQVFRQITGGRRLPDLQVENIEYWTGKWGVPLQNNESDGKWFAIYNSSDGPLLYLITLAEYCARYGQDVLNDEFIHRPTGEKRKVGDAGRRCIDAVMKSIEESEDKGSGLYAVPNTNPLQTSPSGVMRDGYDSYYYPEGEAGKPVDFGFLAYIDNQALLYEALDTAAPALYPYDPEIKQWRHKAQEILTRAHEAFWMEEAGIYAAAVDIQGKQVKLESNAAAEILNGPFLKRLPDGPDIVRSIIKWLYSEQVMTPVGPRMLHEKFSKFEGDYYAYQGTGAVWPHANGIIAKGLRYHWGLHSISHDLGARRTLGSLNRAGEAVEVMFAERKTNEPLYNPYESQLRSVGARAIAAAEFGQLDQGWAATAGLREIWDWRNGAPEELQGSWQRAFSRQIIELASYIPPADELRAAAPLYLDVQEGKKLKKSRADAMGLAA